MDTVPEGPKQDSGLIPEHNAAAPTVEAPAPGAIPTTPDAVAGIPAMPASTDASLGGPPVDAPAAASGKLDDPATWATKVEERNNLQATALPEQKGGSRFNPLNWIKRNSPVQASQETVPDNSLGTVAAQPAVAEVAPAAAMPAPAEAITAAPPPAIEGPGSPTNPIPDHLETGTDGTVSTAWSAGVKPAEASVAETTPPPATTPAEDNGVTAVDATAPIPTPGEGTEELPEEEAPAAVVAEPALAASPVEPAAPVFDAPAPVEGLVPPLVEAPPPAAPEAPAAAPVPSVPVFSSEALTQEPPAEAPSIPSPVAGALDLERSAASAAVEPSVDTGAPAAEEEHVDPLAVAPSLPDLAAVTEPESTDAETAGEEVVAAAPAAVVPENVMGIRPDVDIEPAASEPVVAAPTAAPTLSVVPPTDAASSTDSEDSNSGGSTGTPPLAAAA